MRFVLRALIVIGSLGACVATAAPAPSDQAPPRVVEGTVHDALTHQPLGRAVIEVSGPGIPDVAVRTGPDGTFRTGELPRGELIVRCRHSGYESVRRRVAAGAGIARVDFELVPKLQ